MHDWENERRASAVLENGGRWWRGGRIEIPDKFAAQLQARWTDVPRHLLERLALEAYRDDILSTREVQELLGLEDRFDVYALYNKYQITTYTLEDLQRDRETSLQLGL